MKLVNEEQKLYLNSSIGSLAMEGFSVTEKEKKLAEAVINKTISADNAIKMILGNLSDPAMTA